MMKTMGPRYFTEGKDSYRIQARYGMDYEFARKCSQAPHFSLTGEIDVKRMYGWKGCAWGMLHEEIARRFPELAHLTRWHLVSTEGPLHYLANARYWWEMHRYGESSGFKANYPPQTCLENFLSTACWGALPDDTDLRLRLVHGWPDMQGILEERLPRLREKFLGQMEALGVLESDPVNA